MDAAQLAQTHAYRVISYLQQHVAFSVSDIRFSYNIILEKLFCVVEQGGGGHLGIPGTSHNAGSTGDLSSVGKNTPPHAPFSLVKPPLFILVSES